jgi:hypothetical protein
MALIIYGTAQDAIKNKDEFIKQYCPYHNILKPHLHHVCVSSDVHIDYTQLAGFLPNSLLIRKPTSYDMLANIHYAAIPKHYTYQEDESPVIGINTANILKFDSVRIRPEENILYTYNHTSPLAGFCCTTDTFKKFCSLYPFIAIDETRSEKEVLMEKLEKAKINVATI